MSAGSHASRNAEIRQHLEHILSAAAFSGASRRSRLLRYLVEQSLEDQGDALKESIIATQVFDRSPDYDPQVDSVVRVEVGRLRGRLAEYYAQDGAGDPIRIEIPRGGYRPVFTFQSLPKEEPAPPTPRRRRLYAMAGAMALVALLTGWLFLRLGPAKAAPPSSIAVLPFVNLGGDPSDEYLGDGLSDVVTQSLAEFNDLSVVARTSAFQYKKKAADVREIGRNLHVGAVLEGSVARRQDSVRIIAQLIRASDGFHLWSHSYDTNLAGIPDVEADISQAARDNLAPPRTSAGRGTRPLTHNPEAHDLYIRAVYQLNLHDVAATYRAMDLARQAADRDPTFAEPYVAMAAGESQLSTLLAQHPLVSAQHAWDDVARALARDPNSSGAHAQKALLAYLDHWDWKESETEFRLALASGSHSSAESLYGWCLMTRGMFGEAQRRLQAAQELDPLSVGPKLNQVQLEIAQRRYPEAKKQLDEIFRDSPDSPPGIALALTLAYWQQDCAASQAFGRKVLADHPYSIGATIGSWGMGDLCPGHPANRKAAVDQLIKQNKLYSPFLVACAYATADAPDETLKFLEQSAAAREPTVMLLKVDREFDMLRQYPRFIALEHRLGLID
jgi:TolB-like protein/Tfp pilus assembly protein PilF